MKVNFGYAILKNSTTYAFAGGTFIYYFNNCIFYKAKIIACKFPYYKFIFVDFRNIEITKTEFRGPIIFGSTFVNGRITNSIITSDIKNCNFTNAIVRNSEICGNIANTSFKNTDLTSSAFLPYAIDFSINSVNFANANLTNVNFSKAKFKNVIFKNADMKGAKLQRKWYNYIKRQGVRNFDKIIWVG